jgi:hypothetical protein
MSTPDPRKRKDLILKQVSLQDRDLTEILLDRDDELVDLQQKVVGTTDEKAIAKMQKLVASKIREARSR